MILPDTKLLPFTSHICVLSKHLYLELPALIEPFFLVLSALNLANSGKILALLQACSRT